MSQPTEFRVLSGCHAGARALVVGGERIGNADDCDLILIDLALQDNAPVWLRLTTRGWSLLDHPPTDDQPHASAQLASENELGVAVFLGGIAVAVCAAESPWPAVPAAPEVVAISPAPQTPSEDAASHDMTDIVDLSATEQPSASIPIKPEHTPVIMQMQGRLQGMRQLPTAFFVLACAVLLLVLWAQLNGKATDDPAGKIQVAVNVPLDDTQRNKQLQAIKLAVARVDPALRLHFETMPSGGTRVVGWVRDIAQLDKLAESLADVRPAPALAVRTAADLLDDLLDAGGPTAPALKFELQSDARVRVSGHVLTSLERDQVLESVRKRAPSGIELVDGLTVLSQQGPAIASWLRGTDFPSAEASWNGDQMVVSLAIDGSSRPRLESLMSRPDSPLVNLPFVMLTRETADAPGADKSAPAVIHASTAPVPFQIRSVVGGAVPYVVLADGSKLQPGGRRAGWRLVHIEPERLVFDGPKTLVVQR